MKLFLSFLASSASLAVGSSVNVTEFDTPFTNTTEVIHGTPFLDTKHCEEVYIPDNVRSKFMRAEGLKYFTYKQGLCPPPYNKYTSKTADSRVPGVTHYKRVKSGSDTANIVLTPCACSGGQSMDVTWSVSNANPAKGSTVSVVGKGTLHEALSDSNCGSYSIQASFGAIKLVDTSTSNCKDSSTSLPLGLGSIQSTAFSCPAQEGAAQFSLSMPIPNLSGKVTATSQSADAAGNCLFCVDMTMTL